MKWAKLQDPAHAGFNQTGLVCRYVSQLLNRSKIPQHWVQAEIGGLSEGLLETTEDAHVTASLVERRWRSRHDDYRGH